MKISVLIKDPGKNPRHVYIENSLKNLQATVGGYIETVTLATDAVIICNEEALFWRPASSGSRSRMRRNNNV